MADQSGASLENAILVFKSIHHVLAAERALLAAGLWCDLTPTPRSIDSDCGMVIEFHAADHAAVAGVVAGLATPPRAVCRPCSGGFQQTAIPFPVAN